MTEFLGKLFDRVYAEKDFSINVAIFVAGLAGMSCYLVLHDSVLTLFAFIISFPIVKIIAGGWHQRLMARKGKGGTLSVPLFFVWRLSGWKGGYVLSGLWPVVLPTADYPCCFQTPC